LFIFGIVYIRKRVYWGRTILLVFLLLQGGDWSLKSWNVLEFYLFLNCSGKSVFDPWFLNVLEFFQFYEYFCTLIDEVSELIKILAFVEVV